MQFSAGELIGPLRGADRVIRALVANFVFVPLLAYVVLQFLPLELPLRVGVFLVASAAGAPFLLKLVQSARGDLALSGALLVLLLVTIVYMPLVVPAVLPEAEVRASAIALPLFLTMLLPLAEGHWVEARNPGRAAEWQPVASRVSSVSLIVLIVVTFLVHFQSILMVLAVDTFLVSLAVIVGAFGIGFLLGGPEAESRSVLALGTAQRNIAAATVVATQGFELPGVLVMVVFHSLLTLIVLFSLAAILRRVTARETVA